MLFIGDSHLARVRRSLAGISADVCNRAIGGSTVFDLRTQLGGTDGADGMRIVLSIGTNDAASWRGVSLAEFTDELARTLRRLNSVAVTYLAPPGVIEARVPPSAPWTNKMIDRYRAAALAACRVRNVRVIRADQLLEPFGPKAFARDGVHLSGSGYRVLLPVINTAVTTSPQAAGE